MAQGDPAQMPLFEPAPVPELTNPQLHTPLQPSLLTVLSFGGGQDSTTLLYMLVLDAEFRARYAPHDLLVIMADTGDEHPATYAHIAFVKSFCRQHGIEFVHFPADMGYHSENWHSLRGFFRAKGTIGSRAYVKSCTDQLKLQRATRGRVNNCFH